MNSRADVIIIGAGAIGLWTALKLRERGVDISIIDRDPPGDSASYGNAGLLTPSLSLPLARPGAATQAIKWLFSRKSPFAIRPTLDPRLIPWLIHFVVSGKTQRFEAGTRSMIELCTSSMSDWESICCVGKTPKLGYQHNGLLAIYESDRSFSAGLQLAEFTGKCGIPWEVWDDERVRHEEPTLHRGARHAISFPGDAHIQPDLAMRHLRRQAIDAGVRIIDECRVTHAHIEGGRVTSISTTLGEHSADDFVIAAGVWSGVLAKWVGHRLPMRSAKGYSMQLHRGVAHPHRAIYLADRRVTVTPHHDTLRLAGTLEIGGFDRSVNPVRAGAILDGACAALGIARPEKTPNVWAGLRPCLSDGMPMIDRLPRCKNAWISTGHQMTGLKCSPSSGTLLAQMMCGEPLTMDPAPFRCSRFKG